MEEKQLRETHQNNMSCSDCIPRQTVLGLCSAKREKKAMQIHTSHTHELIDKYILELEGEWFPSSGGKVCTWEGAEISSSFTPAPPKVLIPTPAPTSQCQLLLRSCLRGRCGKNLPQHRISWWNIPQ